MRRVQPGGVAGDVGGDAPRPPPARGRTRRPAQPGEQLLLGAHGLDLHREPAAHVLGTLEKYVPDLLADKFIRKLHRKNLWLRIYYLHAALLVAAAFFAGWAIFGELEDAVQLAAQMFVWGVVVRTVYVWHVTWLVNSAAHRWGYQNYKTGDESRNNWVVAALTNGEGWHNNHHAAPRSAAHGHRWWEVDLTYTFIRCLELVGLAKQVVPVKVAAYKAVEEK